VLFIAEFRRSYNCCGSDVKVWDANIDGRTVRCAKIHNATSLTKTGTDVWLRLVNVRRLDIEDPQRTLQTVPKQLYFELPNLESLTVTWTQIRSLPPSVFQLPLTTLHLQRNQIKSLDGLEQVTRLTVLDVSHNMLETLPDVFVHLTSLEVLNVSGNRIAELRTASGQRGV